MIEVIIDHAEEIDQSKRFVRRRTNDSARRPNVAGVPCSPPLHHFAPSPSTTRSKNQNGDQASMNILEYFINHGGIFLATT